MNFRVQSSYAWQTRHRLDRMAREVEMPNARTHGQFGAVAGAGTCVVLSDRYGKALDASDVALRTAAGIFGGLLPDLLEPALSPRHRGIAHSAVILLLLAIAVWYFTRKSEEEDALPKMMIASAGMGYLSHLLADACTPAGLPLFR